MVWTVAATATVAGIGVGAAIGAAVWGARETANGARRGAEQFVDSLERRYALRTDQVRLLRAAVVDEMTQREEILLSLSRHDVPSDVQRQLDTVQRKLDTRIEFILDPEQRKLWLRDVKPTANREVRSATTPAAGGSPTGGVPSSSTDTDGK